MTPPDPQSLLTLLEREQHLRDDAARALQQAQAQQAHAQAQADQLTQYRADYVDRWSLRLSQTATIEILQCYRSFMQRLDQALAQQKALSDRAQASTNACRATLLDAERRVAAVQKLLERRAGEQRLVTQRSEQRQADETAQRVGWAARQSSSFSMLH
jgi:flagellar protein FliJ